MHLSIDDYALDSPRWLLKRPHRAQIDLVSADDGHAPHAIMGFHHALQPTNSNKSRRGIDDSAPRVLSEMGCDTGRLIIGRRCRRGTQRVPGVTSARRIAR